MARNSNTVRKRGFSFLSLLLGFLLGIIFVLGAVVGGTYLALNSDLDKVLSFLGMDNSKDENGKHRYVNTTEAEGGVRSVLDLFKKIVDMGKNFNDMSVREIENLLPSFAKLIDSLGTTLNEYIEIDIEEMRDTKFGNFASFMQEIILDIKPGILVEKIGFGEAAENNKLLHVLLYGAEAQYVHHDGETYPIYFDVYTLENSVYVRDGDGHQLPATLNDYLEKDAVPAGSQQTYTLYFYEYNATKYVTYMEHNGTYEFTGDNQSFVYADYNADTETCTGTYYYNHGEKIVLFDLKLRDFAEGTAITALNRVRITEFIEIEGDGDLVYEIIGGITVGMFLNSTINFNDILSGVRIASLVKIDINEPLLAYLGYGVTDVSARIEGQDYKYTAQYDGKTCYIVMDGDKVEEIYYYDGGDKVKVQPTTVNNVADRLSGATDVLAFADFIDVYAPGSNDYNAILAFLGYGVTGLEPVPGNPNQYTGKYYKMDKKDADYGTGEDYVQCTVEVYQGKISRVYTQDGGNQTERKKTKIGEINERLNIVTEVLTLGDIINPTANDGILFKLKDKTIKEIPDAINDLTLGDVIEIKTDNKLMNKFADTKIGELADVMDTLGMSDFVTIYLGSVTTDNKPTSEVVIMTYIAYGVNNIKFYGDGTITVTENGGSVTKHYTHTGTYHTFDKQTYNCFIVTEKDLEENDICISEIWYQDGGNYFKVEGTAVDDIQKRIKGVTGDLTIGELLDEATTENAILDSLKDSTIESIPDDLNKLSINQLYANDIYGKDGEPEAVSSGSFDAAYVYYVKVNGKLELANGTGKLTSLPSDTTYYTYGAPISKWKLILYSDNSEQVFYINDVPALIDNVTENIQKSTIAELDAAGVIEVEDDVLEKTVPGMGKKYGQCTLKEVIDFLNNMAV